MVLIHSQALRTQRSTVLQYVYRIHFIDRHEGNSAHNRPPRRIHLSEEWNKQVHIKKQNLNFHSIHFIFLSLIISVHINGKNMSPWLQSKILVFLGRRQPTIAAHFLGDFTMQLRASGMEMPGQILLLPM